MDLTIPNSVYIDGQWFAATWLAEIADPATGELVITATVEQPTRVAALRLTNDMMSDLRTQAGFTGPTPSQRVNRTAPSAPCYDCRTTRDRIVVQEERLRILSDTTRRIVAEIDQRLNALEVDDARD